MLENHKLLGIFNLMIILRYCVVYGQGSNIFFSWLDELGARLGREHVLNRVWCCKLGLQAMVI